MRPRSRCSQSTPKASLIRRPSLGQEEEEEFPLLADGRQEESQLLLRQRLRRLVVGLVGLRAAGMRTPATGLERRMPRPRPPSRTSPTSRPGPGVGPRSRHPPPAQLP